jgi:hypothetical protein
LRGSKIAIAPSFRFLDFVTGDFGADRGAIALSVDHHEIFFFEMPQVSPAITAGAHSWAMVRCIHSILISRWGIGRSLRPEIKKEKSRCAGKIPAPQPLAIRRKSKSDLTFAR